MSRGYLGLFGLAIAALAAIYLFVNSILISDIHRHVSLKERLATASRAETDLRQSLAEAKERLAALESYAPFLEGLERPMDRQELQRLLAHYFADVELEELEREQEGELQARRYAVRVRMEGTRPFFTFLEDIKKRRYPMEVELPLRMQKEGERISASFGLRLLAAR